MNRHDERREFDDWRQRYSERLARRAAFDQELEQREWERRRRVAKMKDWTALCLIAFVVAFIAGGVGAYWVAGGALVVACVAGGISDYLAKRV